jgi:hypothetical protein
VDAATDLASRCRQACAACAPSAAAAAAAAAAAGAVPLPVLRGDVQLRQRLLHAAHGAEVLLHCHDAAPALRLRAGDVAAAAATPRVVRAMAALCSPHAAAMLLCGVAGWLHGCWRVRSAAPGSAAAPARAPVHVRASCAAPRATLRARPRLRWIQAHHLRGLGWAFCDPRAR